MLNVSGLCKQLGAFALRDVAFEVASGDYFVLLGVSGVGKTVLLEMLAGILSADAGSITLDGTEITRKPPQRRGMGLVYQDQALFPHLAVRQNIAYGLHGRLRRASRRARVEELAAAAGVSGLLDRYPSTLSGGEAQRVALARTLAVEPRCLLLDEPIASLDAPARASMRALLRGLHRQGQTVVHVTHDYEEAIALATRVAVMEQGTIVQTGTPKEVFQRPRSEFVARFVGIRNSFAGRLDLPPAPGATLRHFRTAGMVFQVLSDAEAGEGSLILRSEDITISPAPASSSAQNTFPGTIVDVIPARMGHEVTVDIGVELAALLTSESVERLSLTPGARVWASFKASAARFIEG